MKTKTINLIFILCLLLTACSTEQVDNADDTTKDAISNDIQTRIGGSGHCLVPIDPLHLQVTYADNVTFQQRISLRNLYRDFVGLHCVLASNHNDVDEIWVVDSDVYNSYCKPCIDANKCCRDVVIEDEEEDIEKVKH